MRLCIHLGLQFEGAFETQTNATRVTLLFSWQGDLTTHLKCTVEKVKQICNLCDYASSQSSRLRSHLITHTGDKPNEESHTGEKPYMRFM